MPQFFLMGSDTLQFRDLGDFACGYIEALFFTSNEECKDKGFYDLAPDALTEIRKDCAAFEKTNEALLLRAYLCGYTAEQAGRDFWFTRNGHGVGYWDRKELEPSGEEWEATRIPLDQWTAEIRATRERLAAESLGNLLTMAAQPCGESDAYIGDDDLVYVS